MKRVALALVFALALLPAGQARANGVASELDEFLVRLDAARSTLTDMTATFRQAKYASLFEETKISTGRFVYRAPGRMLWEYQTPDHSFLRVDSTDVRFYFPLLEQIEVYPLAKGHGASSLMASFEESTDELKGAYDIALLPAGTAKADFDGEAVEIPEATGMRLVPTDPALQEQFTQVDVWVHPESFMPCLLIISEPTGDRTTFAFDDIAVNTGLDDAALDFDAPPGTEIVRVESQS